MLFYLYVLLLYAILVKDMDIRCILAGETIYPRWVVRDGVILQSTMSVGWLAWLGDMNNYSSQQQLLDIWVVILLEDEWMVVVWVHHIMIIAIVDVLFR